MVTSSWPRDDKPAYGIFVKRQVESLAAAGVRPDVLQVAGYRSFLAYPAAALYLLGLNLSRRHRYRIVHAHGGEVGVAAWFYRRAPLLVSYFGDDLQGTARTDGTLTRTSRLKRIMLRRHARLAQATITKSEAMESVLPADIRGRNTVIPNGVDRDEFRPIPRESARSALGWGKDDRVVLFAADPAIPVKRHWLAVAACEEARRSLGAIRLHVAADVPGSDMPTLMSAADCLLLTSVLEGSPNAVKEALMCNLPVVTTRVGDVEHVLRDVHPSWIVDSSAGALGAALVECLDTPSRSNGREVSEWLAAPRIAKRVLEKYAALGRTVQVAVTVLA